MSADYSNTYWCRKGKYEAGNSKLEKLVPTCGPVSNADGNPRLETFRTASNCYYDLYNNGLCNRAEEFAEVFGFDAAHMMDEGELTQEVVDRAEEKMNEIILMAVYEQFIEG